MCAEVHPEACSGFHDGGELVQTSPLSAPCCRWASPRLGGRTGATWHQRWQRENSLSLSDRPASAPLAAQSYCYVRALLCLCRVT